MVEIILLLVGYVLTYAVAYYRGMKQGQIMAEEARYDNDFYRL
jgi:hypothetical protein